MRKFTLAAATANALGGGWFFAYPALVAQGGTPPDPPMACTGSEENGGGT